MTDHHRVFKELRTTFFVEFIALFFPAVADYLDASSIIFLGKEIFTDKANIGLHSPIWLCLALPIASFS